MDITVFYLCWIPYGIKYFDDFLENYLQKPAGYEHKLIILLNGVALSDPATINTFRSLPAAKKIQHYKIIEFDSGQDISVYQRAATQVQSGYFLFLNSYSHFETNDWLKLYASAWNKNVGLIGATGSYASYRSAVYEQTIFDLKSKKPIAAKINSIKYLVKILLLQRNKFHKFPAPHIRTNGFFTSKDVFQKIETGNTDNKMKAYYFENGKKSLTQQVLKMGLDCVIIDRFGKTYSIPQWPLSKVFWTNNQENLLLSDNQTRKYMEAAPEEKQLLKKIAWNL